MKKYTFFWESRSVFSNWHPARFIFKERIFANTEQAFMWLKAIEFKDYLIADKILKTTDPREVKKLGRMVRGFDAEMWTAKSFDAMFQVNIAKFSQNSKMREELLANENFVEASPYDKIWGIGMRSTDEGVENPENWRGKNLLGKVLDKVREEFLKPQQNGE